MQQLITKTVILDKETLKKQLRESFFKHAANLIKTKIFYELQMSSKDTTTCKTFQETGGAKIASAYTCLLKIFKTRHSITNHELELSFERLEQYLNTTTNVIKEGILAQFNKDETETIISNQTPLDIETIQEFQDNFIVPMIWWQKHLHFTSKEEVKKHNTIATTRGNVQQ